MRPTIRGSDVFVKEDLRSILDGLTVASEAEFTVGPAQSRWVPVRLQIAYGAAAPGSHPIRFNIDDTDGTAPVSEQSVFLGPR